MRLTHEQQDIRDHSAGMGSSDNLKVIAFAGAGKTTTLKAVASAKSQRGVYLAFNKAIADEAKRKLAMTRCTAATMHGLAYGAVREVIGSPVTHNARSFRETGIMSRFHIPKVEGWNDYRVASAVCRALAAFCNSDDQDFDIRHAEEALISSIGDPELIRDRERQEHARDTLRLLSMPILQMAETFWGHSVERNQYSHDMYLKALDLDESLRADAFRSFRYLMVDEAQDINPVQRSIITKTGLPIIAVGDPYQQIYSWRGAENALALLPGKTMYLTQSFRFGEGIAEVARHILQTRPDGGPAQRLTGAGSGDISGHAGSRAAIICRTNIGMIEEALKLMHKNISLHVDNMAGLLQDVRSAQALFEGRTNDVVSTDLKQYESWDELKVEAEEGDQSLGKIVNLVEGNMVPQIERLAEHQRQGAGSATVMICTAHRSKGLEWPAVQLGSDWKDIDAMTGRYRKSLTQSDKHKTLALEEWNALYVAATRPIMRLQGHQRILFPKPKLEEDYAPADLSEERGRTAPAQP
ncbi:UvrD-helicase domain-containing protein [Defluviimonas salinarum]|uniref:UvrD-helicase domain-containing protein n=1 Tax=Defluviimonas salinarum TaxID=2992147 RepID=A0ABT3JAD4_9RHOB|nr:UvrD-helicase domain-containing protein [Defluviimonas salinarum]MCW3784651.1 UvrD-helicase domain-containing protein [Defluviimonas salinarum]